jgi:hypothetical protein
VVASKVVLFGLDGSPAARSGLQFGDSRHSICVHETMILAQKQTQSRSSDHARSGPAPSGHVNRAHPIQHLQGTIGNQAVQRLLRTYAKEGVEILRQRGSQISPRASFEPTAVVLNCAFPFNPDEIRSAFDVARIWVRLTVSALNRFRSGRLTRTENIAVTAALRDNFHTVDPFFTSQILNNFRAIEAGLSQSLQFYCTLACMPGDLAYVFRNAASLGLPNGLINICPEFFGCSPLKQASTIIHERAHEVLGARDLAYEISSDYDALAPISAIANADSYAVTARQIVNSGLYGPGLSCTILSSRIRPLVLQEPPFQMPQPAPPGLWRPE